MSYQSIQFLAFSGVALLIYYTIGRKRQLAVLAAANLAFYVAAGLKHIPFLLVTMLSTFFAARRIGAIYSDADARIAACADAAQKKQLRAAAKKDAKKALGWGMGIAIGLLAVCKYTGFVLENLNMALGGFGLPQIPMFRMILPLGISFYTFMALSYVLDVYWKRYRAEESFLTYAVYLSYFPHVVQGPIDRFGEFRDQVREVIAFDYQTFTFGAQLALWGFFKKLFIADRLGLFVDNVFSNWGEFRGFVLIASVAVYSIQIYTDFSGCIDIVTGVSEMFGIRLRKNFNHPYFSRSMGEFWRRWHISLQEWFKDYVYFPVSTSSFVRSTKKRLRAGGKSRASDIFATCFPLFVVWMTTGIWHGAAWKYVAWGIFHAAVLILSFILEPAFAAANQRLRIRTESWPWRLWQMLRTFAICCLGRVFFRANNLGMAFGMLGKMSHFWITPSQLLDPNVDYGIGTENIILSAIGLMVLFIVDALQERMSLRETLARKNIVLRWALIYACIFAILIFGVYGSNYGSTFIYEQF